MNKEILRLAIPNIISNISIPLLSSVDTMLMGHNSALELGAVGVASTIFNIIYWNFGFLRMGTTGMTAQAFGKADAGEIAAMLQKSVFLGLIISFIILLFMMPIGNIAALLMNVEDAQKGFVLDYFFVRIWAAPATLALYAFFGWFFGMQNSKIPLVITISINIINIALSYYFVKVLGLGIKGVALGTVISQYTGMVLSIFFVFLYFKRYLHFIALTELINREKISRFFRINKDIFIRTICLSFAFAFLYAQSAIEGEVFLAANVVLMQFLNWMSYGIDGFAYAGESLVGKYFGAGEAKKTYKVIKLIFLWGLVLATLYALIYLVFGNAIIRIFTNQPEVIAMSNKLLIWVVLIPLIAFSCYIWDGIYIGLTASVSMRNTMIIALIVYLLVFYCLKAIEINNVIWIAMFVFLGSRGIFQSLLFTRKGLSLN